MTLNNKDTSIRRHILFIIALVNVIIIRNGFILNANWYYLLIIFLPVLILTLVI